MSAGEIFQLALVALCVYRSVYQQNNDAAEGKAADIDPHVGYHCASVRREELNRFVDERERKHTKSERHEIIFAPFAYPEKEHRYCDAENGLFGEVRRLADVVSHRFAFNSEYARYEGCHAVAYLTRCFARNERIAPDEHQHDYDENCQCNGLFFSFSHKFSCFFPIGWLFFVIGVLGGASLQK